MGKGAAAGAGHPVWPTDLTPQAPVAGVCVPRWSQDGENPEQGTGRSLRKACSG